MRTTDMHFDLFIGTQKGINYFERDGRRGMLKE